MFKFLGSSQAALVVVCTKTAAWTHAFVAYEAPWGSMHLPYPQVLTGLHWQITCLELRETTLSLDALPPQGVLSINRVGDRTGKASLAENGIDLAHP
jgi:hypothetical protein